MANERNVETIIDKILKENGWIDDIHKPNRDIYKQEFKNIDLNTIKNGRPDYALYDGDQCIAIIEAKKANENLKNALDQAERYAKISKAKIIMAYDGVVFKSKFLPNSLPLEENGIELEVFPNKNKILKFLKENSNKLETSIMNISQSELIDKFSKIDKLLKNSGLEAGSERFTNLSTLIFIKISSDLDVKNDNWRLLKGGEINIDYINKSLINYLNKKYKNHIFSELTIPENYTNNLKKIMDILDEIDFNRINSDVKGGAYEYFLSKYNAGSKDLAQYYTPRHLINFMTKFINPRIKDKIYDPFCGTGGMLIVAFNHLHEKIKNELPKIKQSDYFKKLKKETIFGREFTKIASITKMNMILIGDGHSNVERGDTFAKSNILNKYNVVLTNIPFGTETSKEFAESYGLNGNVKEKKFLGEPSAILHILNSLKKREGKAAIIVPTGVLYRTYKNDRLAREKMIKSGLRFIVNLPPNVFLPYTPAQTSILFIDNSIKNIKKDFISFYNLKNDGYTLDTKRNKIEGFNDFDKLLMEYDLFDDEYKKYNFINYLNIKQIEKNKFNLYYNDYEINAPKIGNFKEYVKLSDICNIFQGPAGTYMQQKKYNKIGPLKVYEQGHVINKDLNANYERYISNEYNFELQKGKFLIEDNDILITMSGTVGRTIIYKDNFEKGVISTALSIIRVKNTKLYNPHFIDIVLQNKDIKKWLNSRIKGTANKGIRLGDVKNILIPRISIKNQNEILIKVNNAKEKIIKNEEQINIQKNIIENLGFHNEN